MDSNPYAPPAAVVADIPVVAAEDAQLAFFPVSSTKLLVMTFCTLGIYQVYWFFMHWRQISRRSGEPMKPVWRAVFSFIYCYSLFRRIKDHSPELPSAKLAAGPLAAITIVTGFLWALPDPYWMVALFGFLPMRTVQQAANLINHVQAPNHNRNARFTAWNWVAVAVGTPLLLLSIVAAIFPELAAE